MRTLLAALLILRATCAHADCLLELELIGADLKGVKLTESQKLAVAPLIDEGQKRCRLGRNAAAMACLEKARRIAGIVRPADDDEPAAPSAR